MRRATFKFWDLVPHVLEIWRYLTFITEMERPSVWEIGRHWHHWRLSNYIHGWVQGCSNSSALAMELPLSFAKPSIGVRWLTWCHSKGTYFKTDDLFPEGLYFQYTLYKTDIMEYQNRITFSKLLGHLHVTYLHWMCPMKLISLTGFHQ